MKESKLSYIALAISVGAAAFCGVSGMLSAFPNSSRIDTLTHQVQTLTEQNLRLNALVGSVAENRLRINELDVGMTAVANVMKIDRGELARAFAAVKSAQDAEAMAAANQQSDEEAPEPEGANAEKHLDQSAPAHSQPLASVEAPSPSVRPSPNTPSAAAPTQVGTKPAPAPTAGQALKPADPARQPAPLMGKDNPFAAGLDSSNAGGEVAPALAVAPAKVEPVTIAQVDAVLGKRISTNWIKPEGITGALSTIIQLKMNRDGTVAKVRMGKSSGNDTFDSSALSAVQSIGTIEEVRQLTDSDFQKAYASRNIQFTPQMGR